MKILIYLIGGILLSAMFIPTFLGRSPNYEELVPGLFYIAGFFISYAYYYWELKDAKEVKK